MRMGVKKLKKTGKNVWFSYGKLPKKSRKITKNRKNLHFLIPPRKKHARLMLCGQRQSQKKG